MRMMTAQEYVSELTANSDAFCDGKITHEAFHEQQVRIWDNIQARSRQMQDRVSKLLRDNLNAYRWQS